jgi:hypothetical protein
VAKPKSCAKRSAASQEGLLSHARRDITAAIASGRFDITDAGLALHVTAGSLLGLTALLDANPDLDAGQLAGQYAARILRAFGLSQPEADSIATRPLPDLTIITTTTGGTASQPDQARGAGTEGPGPDRPGLACWSRGTGRARTRSRR